MIDLFSDTQTRPTPAMRRAIAEAEVGDEQLGEDPAVNALQDRVATLLGHEAGLFLPSGTMCNQIAIKVHTQPGDCILADRNSHVMRAEGGGPAFHSGVLIDPIPSPRGIFTPGDVLERIPVSPGPHVPPVTLLCVEQTHNYGGGSVWPLGPLRDVCDAARSRSLATHLDGARLLNASVASGVRAADFARCCDSAWIDLSKGLGCPVGAVLVGSSDFIRRARRYKHLFGGAMRQAGIVAAAGIHALDHHVDRLADDHAHARRLADGLAAIAGVTILNPDVPTNLVFIDLRGTGVAADGFVAAMKQRGVRMGLVGGMLRAVTHLDVSRDDIDRAVAIASEVIADLR